MKFKNKLIISFCIIIFIPIALALPVLFSFQRIQLRAIEQAYGVKDETHNYFSGSSWLLSRIARDSFQELARVALQEPARFAQEEYLAEMNQKLSEKNSFLAVRRDDEWVYVGEEEVHVLLGQFPPYGEAKKNVNVGTYIDGDEQLLLRQVDFPYPGGGLGSAFLVTRLEAGIPEMKSLVADIAISVLLILILTACMLMIWIYTSMINPIKRLQAAAQNIKDGNLDFTVFAENDDEIGELCRNFEEMRQRLKDNAEEKISGERENKALINNIAHDLKTPITAVKGYAEGLIDGVADTPEKRDKYIRTIYNKAIEMDTLINELTLYAKIDTNRIPYNFAKLNVAAYFDDCIEEIGLDLESRGIGLSYFNYADEEIQIIADPEQLKRVINNIVGNSVKYMGNRQGVVHIRIKDVGDFIQVEVEDNGRGIAARDLPYIFDRFYRADASRSSATGGSGIGLSIVKKIVEDHGGKIWATSKEDVGTVMYFVIRKYQEVPNEQVIDY